MMLKIFVKTKDQDWTTLVEVAADDVIAYRLSLLHAMNKYEHVIIRDVEGQEWEPDYNLPFASSATTLH
jgi:hypothetical protein